jgi:uncharacterized membrane protein YfcA
MELLTYITTGALAGILAGLLGIGGGVFIMPLLVYLLKMPVKTAAATSIFIVVFSSFSGFVAHVSFAGTQWKFIVFAAVFSFAGAIWAPGSCRKNLKNR